MANTTIRRQGMVVLALAFAFLLACLAGCAAIVEHMLVSI